MKERTKTKNEPFDPAYIFNNHQVAVEKYEQLRMLQKLPESILAVAYHRRFYNRPHGLFSEQQPQLLSSPLVMYLPLMPTGRRIYEEIWSMANILLKNPKKVSLPWW